MAKFLRFDLNLAEAKFFRARFLELFPDSITSYVLKHPSQKTLESPVFALNCSKHAKLHQLLSQARIYSGIAMGAYYAYRWALCRARRKEGRLSREAEKANAEHFGTWVTKNLREAVRWKYTNLTDALGALGGSVPKREESSEFVERFLHGASRSGGVNRKLSALDEVVKEREEGVKGRNYSHFANPNLQMPRNTLGTDDYRDQYFDYRWSKGRANLKDIFRALGRR